MVKQQLRQFYKAVERRLPSADRAPFFKNLMLHPQQPIAYARVPKAGCSTIIAHLLGADFPMSEGSKGLHSQNALITFDDPNFSEKLRTASEDTKLFTVVRDPFSRLLSGFREKIERKLDGPRYRIEFGIDGDAAIDFNHFVDVLVDRDPLTLDVHFQPQTLITRADVLSYDQIFRLERMSLALHWLDTVLVEAPDQPAAVAPHATNASSAVTSVYDTGTARKVAEYYAQDFALFGYATEPGAAALDAAVDMSGTTPLARFPLGAALTLDSRLRAFIPALLNRH